MYLDDLRKTDDIDICLLTNTINLYALEREEEIGDEIYQIILKRNGTKKPIIQVHSLNDCSEIKLNISYSKDDAFVLKEFYDEMIETADDILLKNNGMTAKTRVAKPEYIIASKLIRQKEKDVDDVKNLILNGINFNLEKIEKMLRKEKLEIDVKSLLSQKLC